MAIVPSLTAEGRPTGVTVMAGATVAGPAPGCVALAAGRAGVGDRLGVAVAGGLGEGVSLRVGAAVTVRVGVAEGLRVAVTVRDGVAVGVADAVAVAVAVDVCWVEGGATGPQKWLLPPDDTSSSL